MENLRSSMKVDVPPVINGMKVTPELRAQYRGIESQLLLRSRYPEHCQKLFDGVTMCMFGGGKRNPSLCKELMESFKPCHRELKQADAMAALKRKDEERRRLTERSKQVQQ